MGYPKVYLIQILLDHFYHLITPNQYDLCTAPPEKFLWYLNMCKNTDNFIKCVFLCIIY